LFLTGPSGAGKSSIVKLIPRAHDVTGGSLRFNGDDIRELKLSCLRRAVAYLPQHAVLFDCSVKENLLLGQPHATRQDLERVAEILELDGILRKLPAGWGARLSPNGYILSGGERQKMVIARAVLSQPSVLIMDEATSQLDQATEVVILQRLKVALPNATLILVSHRVPAPEWPERVCYMKDGELVRTTCEFLKQDGAWRVPQGPVCDLDERSIVV
jgi:ABC-type bacteriocin/lantibiotic exporter with double-glycine peptidase domain